MTELPADTLSRDRRTCVEMLREPASHHTRRSVSGITRRLRTGVAELRRMIASAGHPHLRDLDDRQLRDIGLTPADIARQRLRLPSRHDHHPRL